MSVLYVLSIWFSDRNEVCVLYEVAYMPTYILRTLNNSAIKVITARRMLFLLAADELGGLSAQP